MNDGILEIVDYVGFHRRTTWERRQLLDSMYLNSSKRSFDDFYREAKRILRPDGTIYVFMGMRYVSFVYAILEQELKMNFNSWITWYYTQGIGKTKGFSPRHDDVLMFTKDPKRFVFNLDAIRVPQMYYRSINNIRGANPGNVWEFSHMHYCNKNRRKHPTQKPEALYEKMILASSNEGDLVLDPFVGSGPSCAFASRQSAAESESRLPPRTRTRREQGWRNLSAASTASTRG